MSDKELLEYWKEMNEALRQIVEAQSGIISTLTKQLVDEVLGKKP